ncbi:hypothetical protein D3C87_1395750 [compost metagenome]
MRAGFRTASSFPNLLQLKLEIISQNTSSFIGLYTEICFMGIFIKSVVSEYPLLIFSFTSFSISFEHSSFVANSFSLLRPSVPIFPHLTIYFSSICSVIQNLFESPVWFIKIRFIFGLLNILFPFSVTRLLAFTLIVGGNCLK